MIQKKTPNSLTADDILSLITEMSPEQQKVLLRRIQQLLLMNDIKQRLALDAGDTQVEDLMVELEESVVQEKAETDRLKKLTASKFEQLGKALNDVGDFFEKKEAERKLRLRQRQKHANWKRLQDQGLSYGQIVLRHLEETGEEVQRDAVIKAIKRLRGRRPAVVAGRAVDSGAVRRHLCCPLCKVFPGVRLYAGC